MHELSTLPFILRDICLYIHTYVVDVMYFTHIFFKSQNYKFYLTYLNNLLYNLTVF